MHTINLAKSLYKSRRELKRGSGANQNSEIRDIARPSGTNLKESDCKVGRKSECAVLQNSLRKCSKTEEKSKVTIQV